MKRQIFIVVLLFSIAVQFLFSLNQALANAIYVPENTAPTISNITAQNTNEDTATGAINFTVGDLETPGSLTVTAVAANTILVPTANITLGGTGAARTINILPAANQSGVTNITVTVSDNISSTNTVFQLTVNAVNDAPTISNIANQVTNEDTATGAIPFTVGDVETAVGSLTVTAVADNLTLVPTANITLGGIGAARTINILPAASQNGVTNVTVTVSDGTTSTNTVFQLTVNAVNDAPTISNIANQVTNEDTATGAIAFTVGDVETVAGSLTVTAVADNLTLVPTANITPGGVGAARTINILPAANQNGVTNVTVTVSDGISSTNTIFQLTVNAVNDVPTISNIINQVTNENVATPPINFTIGDAETAPSALSVTAVSSNVALVPNGNISLVGSEAARTITLTPLPNISGSTTISVTVSDSQFSASTNFNLTVTPVNDPPTISAIANQSTDEDIPTGIIPFTIGDIDTPIGQLSVTAVSSNATLVPNNVSNIVLAGTGTARTINLIPVLNANGTTTITVTVNDTLLSTESDFLLTVNAVNDAPHIDLNGSNGGGSGFATTYATNGNPVNLTDSDLIVNDIDSLQLQSATVTIANPLDGAAELLAANTSGTNINSNYSGGVLTLTNQDTLANYRQVINTVTYQNNAVAPTLTDRNVDFVVNDGFLNSVNARTVVSILNPHISIVMAPETQTIASGGTAIFTVKLESLGNAELTNISISDPLAPNCDRTYSLLSVGAIISYSCNRTAVTSDFTNEATVTARDPLGGTVTAVDTSRVEVDNPNIQIVKSPTSQTIRRGEDAQFNVFVFNTSSTVDLVNVEVLDPLVPDCDRTGNHSFDDLDAGTNTNYSCKLTNVEAAFTNVINVTGENLLTGEIVQDSSIAIVEVLDMNVILEATPTELTAPGGLVAFTVTINNIGSLDLTLDELTSAEFGDLTDLANGNVDNNECEQGSPPLLPANGGDFTCSFTAIINDMPGDHDFSVTAVAKDDDDNDIQANDTTNITIEDVSGMDVTLFTIPASLPAPGGLVTITVGVVNTSYSATINVDTLTDSRLGDLNGQGSCVMPQSIPPQTTYNCSYTVNVFGGIGDSQSRSVSASGTDSNSSAISDSNQTTILFTNPSIRTILLPAIAHNYAQPDEPNNNKCAAFPIMIGKNYTFEFNDRNDWYHFDMPSAGEIEIKATNFVPKDGQLLLYGGSSCQSITNIGNDGSFNITRIIKEFITPGRYYVWVLNNDGVAYEQSYTLSLTINQ